MAANSVLNLQLNFKKLAAQLIDVKAMRFWYSEVTLMLLVSPTKQWLSAENTGFNGAVLQVKQCRGSHISEFFLNIRKYLCILFC